MSQIVLFIRQLIHRSDDKDKNHSENGNVGSSHGGFTLIELIVVITLMAILSIVAVTSLIGKKNSNDLSLTTSQVIALLHEAESRSIAQAGDVSWGLHFSNPSGGTPFYALFSSFYSPTTTVSYYRLPSDIGYTLTTLPAGGAFDVIFSQISGIASVSTTIGFYNRAQPDLLSGVCATFSGTIYSCSATSTGLAFISSLSPSSVVAPASQDLTLTVNGLLFTASDTVEWNNVPLQTTFVSSSTLTAVVPFGDIQTGNVVPVTVWNAFSGSSGMYPFTINNPFPSLTSISPTSSFTSLPSFVLTVNGTNFISGGSTIYFGSTTPLTTTYVSQFEATATVPSADITASGTVSVMVVNSSPAGGASNAQPFLLITSPTSTITITTSPAGLPATVDGVACAITPCQYQWPAGHNHTLVVNPTISGTGGASYTFVNWSGGVSSTTDNIVSPGSPATYTATFSTSVSFNGYTYVRPITVTSTLSIASGTQTNFPMLFLGTYSWLAATSSGGNLWDANGYDHIFSTSTACTYPLNYETEKYTSSNGAIINWVNVPSLSAGTILYICYGSASVTTSQANPAGTWSGGGYGGVWHVADNGGTLTLNDSTVNGDNGTNNGMAASSSGPIYGSAYDNGGSWIAIPNPSNGVLDGYSVTASAWIYPYVSPGGHVGIVCKGNGGSPEDYLFGQWPGGNLKLSYNNGGGWSDWESGYPPSLNTWQLATWVVRGGSGVDFYINGQYKQTISGNPSLPSSANDFWIGAENNADEEFTGLISEVRFSPSARSASWILDEYNTENSPSTFYTIGTPLNSSSVDAVLSSPSGITLGVGSSTCTTPCYYSWTQGSQIALSASSTIAVSTGTQYVWNSWSDNGSQTHTITAPSTSTPAVYTAYYITQYYLTTAQLPGGSISPSSGWFNSGTTTAVYATSSAGYQFIGFSGALTGTTTPQNIMMSGPVSVTAGFAPTGTINGYFYERPITITSNFNLASGTQTNFPLLFSGTYSWLMPFAATSSGALQSVNGYDHIYSTSTACNYPLNYENIYYSSSTGAITDWINVPSLSAGTVFYICYGNPNITTSQANPAGTWNSNYQGVWHLKSSGSPLTLSTLDSTSNGFNGVNLNSSTTATTTGNILGEGAAFQTSSIEIADNPALRNPTAFTVSVWFKANNSAVGSQDIVDKALNGPPWSSPWLIYMIRENNASTMEMDVGSGQTFSAMGWSATTNNNTWYYGVITYVSNPVYPVTGTEKAYLNGALLGTNATVSGALASSSNPVVIGADQGCNPLCEWFNGAIEEVRISNTTLPSSWILTEYNNQSSPSTFYTVGNQISGGFTTPISTSPSGLTVTVDSATHTTPWYFNWANNSSHVLNVSSTIAVNTSTQDVFSNWSDGTLTTTDSITATPSSSPTAWTANFTTQYYLTTILADAGGTIIPSAGNNWENILSTPTVSVTTFSGYSFVGFSGALLGAASSSQTLPAMSAPVSVTASFAPTSTFNGYYYESAITVTSTISVASGTQTNFPMFISGIYPWLATVPNGGYLQNINGYDHIYSTSANCSNPLNYETENYSSSTGAISDWVQVPSLSAGTVIYLCYDNPNITVLQANPTSTWIGYDGVWHLSAVPNFTSVVGAASFVKEDTTTEGSWPGVYGHDGYAIPTLTAEYPSYVTVTALNVAVAGSWLNPTVDPRGLFISPGFNNLRNALYWVNNNGPTNQQTAWDMVFTGGVHQLAIYALDYDACGNGNPRNIVITIYDGNGVQLSSRAIPNYQIPSRYEVWNVSGHIRVVVTLAAGGCANQTIGGFFFDPSVSGVASGSGVAPLDSTAYGNAGLNSSTTFAAVMYGPGGMNASNTFAASGPVNGAATTYYGDASFINLPNLSGIATSSISIWFKTASSTADGGIIGDSNAGPTSTPGGYNAFLYIGTDYRLRGGFYNGVAAPPLYSTNAVSSGVWHQAVWTNNGIGTSTQSLYLDGAFQTSTMAEHNSTWEAWHTLGAVYSNGWGDGNGTSWFYFPGSYSELEISSVALSPGWIVTEYNNQNNPGTFYSVSGPVNSGSATGILSSYTGLTLTVDGSVCTTPCYYNWSAGTNHTITAASTIASTTVLTPWGSTGAQYIFSNWSDLTTTTTDSVTAAFPPVADTANYILQYYLLSDANVGGSISPSSEWINVGSSTSVSVTTVPGYVFWGFGGALTGATNPQYLTPTSTPLSVEAIFTPTSTFNGYYYENSITVTSTPSIASGTQTNFPMLFSGTYPWLASMLATSSGELMNANGYDHIYSTSTACTHPLNYETESYSPPTGAINEWVNVPTISTGTVIYICYGNPNITTSQASSSRTWNSNYVGVWHLAVNNGTLSTIDSTASGNNGTNNGEATTSLGIFNGAGAAISSATSSILIPTSTILNLTGHLTLEIWVYPEISNNYQTLIGKVVGSTRQYYYDLSTSGGGYIYVALDNSPNNNLAVSPAWTVNAWNHIVLTWDGSNDRIYINGVLAETYADTTAPNSASSPVWLGNDASGFNIGVVGYLDEARISNTALSSSWISTEYKNQSSPSTFYTVGNQVGSGVSTVITTSPSVGLPMTVDLAGCTTPCYYDWTNGTQHTITATSTAALTGSQYTWSSWSDSGSQTHNITASMPPGTYTATYSVQYLLTTNVVSGGTISPGSTWYNSLSTPAVSATANPGYLFAGFSGALSGTTNPQNVAPMTGPISVTANFTPTTTYNSGLVGWWTFDEASGTYAYDYSGHSNTGTWIGVPTGLYSSGHYPRSWAGMFNATSAMISVTSTSALAIGGSGSAVTLAAWIYNTTTTGGWIVRKGYEAGNGSEWGMYTSASSTGVNLAFRTVPNAAGRSYTAEGTVMALNTWYFVTVTCAYGATTPNYYINGVLQPVSTLLLTDGSGGAFNFPVTSFPVNIGASSEGLGYTPTGYFGGLIDDLRIYNIALSSTTVQSLYTTGY